MWRWFCVSALIMALGVGPGEAADRETAPDVGVVPKVVRTIPILTNNEPAWSSRSVDTPIVGDSKASGELITHTAGEVKVVPPPVRAAEVGGKVVQPPARAAHIDPFNVLGAVGGVLISLAIVLAIYAIRTRPVRPDAPWDETPGRTGQVPPWMKRRDRSIANSDVPSVEVFEREMGKIIMATGDIGGSRTSTKPFAFDPYA
jgi:hypothetical protein